MTTEQVSSLMKGEPGTRLKMKVAKFYTGDTVQVELKREIINIPGIPYYGMLPDSVGYILNIDFTDEVSNDMRNAIMSLREQGAKALYSTIGTTEAVSCRRRSRYSPSSCRAEPR